MANTIAIITKGTTIQNIVEALSLKFKNIEVIARNENFMNVMFQDKKEEYSFYVQFDNSCEKDYNISGVMIYLKNSSKSVSIARYISEKFGGYIDDDDCDNDYFYPINHHLYVAGNEFTKLDEFKHRVICELGYSQIDICINLLKKYKEINFEK